MIVIRNCEGFDELEACVQLQVETWGYDANEVVPRKTFLVAQKIGGQLIGAFDTDIGSGSLEGGPESLVGYVFSLPGIKTPTSGDGTPASYLHSHMLAVQANYRNRGLGARLKLEQRREALSRGIRHIEWTFDPLEIKNAFLNIHKLGALVCHYRPEFYGVSSSRLQGGLPTDRLLAEWELDSGRVQRILNGQPAVAYAIEEQILVPASISEWKAIDAFRERALTVQTENRRKFKQAFSRGLSVVDFHLDEHGNGVFDLGHLPPGAESISLRNARGL